MVIFYFLVLVHGIKKVAFSVVSNKDFDFYHMSTTIS